MNTNENFDALWNSFRDEVRKARAAEKQAIVRPAGGGEMGHYIAAGNDLALDGSQPIALSTPHSSSYIRIDAEGCRALAAQLFACSLKVDEAKGVNLQLQH